MYFKESFPLIRRSDLSKDRTLSMQEGAEGFYGGYEIVQAYIDEP